MKFTSIFAATALFAVTFAATITFVEGPLATTTQAPAVYIPSISPTLHAIGTGADGMTTYVEEYAVSEVVQLNPIQTGSDGVFNPSTTFGTATSTATITPGPVTMTYTFAADASRYDLHYETESSADFPDRHGEDDECAFDGKSSIICVDKLWIGSLTATFTGPATTIITTIAAETKASGAVPGSRSVKESCIAWGVFAIGVLSAWVLLL
ncbi:hypothetical protein C0992_004510 [Termitomyces sp. T32_za158]|nr:hypothetical protein C0992_004510 [Termitomyces sp. T32_za158]